MWHPVTRGAVQRARPCNIIQFTLQPGDPLAKARTMHKFEAQMWQLAIHLTVSALEYYILFVESGGKEWWEGDISLSLSFRPSRAL